MDKNYSVRLITFGGGGKNYVKSAQRVVRDACKIGTISSARAFGESDLGEDYDKLFPSFPKRYPRGFGFWSWKPFLIAQELHNLSESDVLLYVDGGCELNSPGKPHLDSYLEFVEQNDVLVFELDTKNKNYTKSHPEFLAVEAFADEMQISATVIFLKKCKKTLDFVDAWLE